MKPTNCCLDVHQPAQGGRELARPERKPKQNNDAPSTAPRSPAQYDVAHVWRGLWGIEGQYDFVHAEFADGEYVPRIPPHRLGGGVYYRDGNWLARAGILHAFDHDQIGLNENASTKGYTLVSAELSYTMKLARAGLNRTSSNIHHRHQRREPCRRRGPQQRLVQMERRGPAAGRQRARVRDRETELGQRCSAPSRLRLRREDVRLRGSRIRVSLPIQRAVIVTMLTVKGGYLPCFVCLR